MNIKRHKGAIASWVFVDESKTYQVSSRAVLDELIEHLAKVVGMLERARLLFPSEVELFGWLPPAVDIAKNEPNQTISVASSAEIIAVIRTRLDALEAKRGFRDLNSVHVFGVGEFVTPDGPQLASNLVWVSAATLGHHMVTVHTQSDVWLPYGLDGHEQAALAAPNAERLANALREIEKTGYTVQYDAQTEYAVIRGFYLDNYRDAAGRVLETVVPADDIE
jgi:hypothetical protein